MTSAFVALVCLATNADAQRGSGEPLAAIRPPGPPPTALKATFTTVNAVTIEWTAAPGAQSYTVVRGFNGMRDRRTFNTTATTYADVVGMLPPNLEINYEVYATYADKSPGRATLTIKTPDTHPVANVAARVEENGRRVVVTWTNTANPFNPSYPYPVDHLWLSAVTGGTRSQVIPAGATTLTLTGLPAGTHTYGIIGYYNLPGVGTVESRPETAPRFTVKIPHCVLIYRRAVDAMELNPSSWFDPPEVLLLGAGETRAFKTDWKHNTQRGTDAERYGSHLREAKNDGTRDIELSLFNSIAGGVTISVLKPGETKTYLLDLARATCAP